MGDKSRKLNISVSGSKFEVDMDIIMTLPTSRLGKMATEIDLVKTTTITFMEFNRPLSSFEAILAYYQTGQLHMPNHVCPKAFQLELDFWGIDASALEKCCLYKYTGSMSDFKTMDTFRNSLNSDNNSVGFNPRISKLKNMRNRIWSVIDNRENTVHAKVYLVTSILFMMISVFSLAFSTLPAFRSPLSECELKRYIEQNWDLFDSEIDGFINSLPCNSLTPETIKDYVDYWEDYFNDGNSSYYTTDTSGNVLDDIPEKTPSRKSITALNNLKLPSKSKVHPVFTYLDYIGIAFFSIELILRMFACPSLKNYFRCILNDIELLVLIAAYINIIVDECFLKYRYEVKGIEILQYVQMFRVLRLFRVMSNITAMRVLSYAFKSGYKDLLVLLMYLFVGVILFSNFLYFAEDTSNIPSIPEAWWWGIITMTTVGYGDVVPKSPIGRIVGGVCALSGVILLSLVIPVFVNTFMSLYQFACLHDKLSESNDSAEQENVTKKRKRSRATVSPIENIKVKSDRF